MNKEFIPYEQALELKKLGFNEPCFATYEKLNDDILIQDATRPFINTNSLLSPFEDQEGYIEQCTSPVYQQAFRWFREHHNFDHFVQHHINGFNETYFSMTRELTWDVTSHETYEEAELACLKKLIEILKNK